MQLMFIKLTIQFIQFIAILLIYKQKRAFTINLRRKNEINILQ